MPPQNVLELCRLCLVKDRVHIPIFEGEGDIRQIFLKIAACLPIKVNKDDRLPKRICDDCLCKVELLYQFWNTTANAEKQLLEWLGESTEEKKTAIEPSVKGERGEPDTGSELAKSLSRVEAVLAVAREVEQDDDDDHFADAPKPETDSDDEPLSSLGPQAFSNVADPASSAATTVSMATSQPMAAQSQSSGTSSIMDPDITTCGYYIERKKRHCRMTVGANQRFCGEHGAVPRVPCPLDPKHSCPADNIDKHVRKCRARVTPGPDYIIPAINSAKETTQVETCSLADLTDSELEELLFRVEEVYRKIPEWETSIMCHETIQPALEEPDCGVKARKHLLQNASLLGNMERHGLIQDGTTFVEFGAGRGQLSFFVGKLLAKKKGCRLVVIDRASTRHKLDNKLKDCAELEVTRVRADIADLDLKRLLPPDCKVIGSCKHLCGEGTDLALQCILQAATSGVNISSLLLAPCCHHRCTWHNFLGQEFLQEWGFPARVFPAICGISSWATCGSGRPRGVDSTEERSMRLGLQQDQREVLGQKAKMVLNYARLKHVEDRGFKGWLYYYIDRAVSPENVCFMAVPKES